MEQLKKECILSFYKELAPLDSKGRIKLVINKQTNQLFVKKQLNIYNLEVFLLLKEHPHKNIPKIIECFEFHNSLIVIEEYISGFTLETVLTKHSPMSSDTIISYMLQLCDTIAFLHNLPTPVIHRDLTPSNILISSDNQVKVIDFNIARHYQENQPEDTTLLGTAGYAAPEQYGFAQSDIRTDIYALGVILNKMVTGEFPNLKLAPSPFTTIVETCIALNADNRFSSAEKLKEALLMQKSNQIVSLSAKENPHVHPFISCLSFLFPGFSSKNYFKLIGSFLWYAFLIYYFISIKSAISIKETVHSIKILLLLWFLTIFYGNINYFKNYLSILNQKRFSVKLLVSILLGILFFTFGAILGTAIENIFF